MRKAAIASTMICAAFCAASAQPQQAVPGRGERETHEPRVSSGAALDKTEQLLDSMLDLMGQPAPAEDGKREARMLAKAVEAARALAALCERTDCTLAAPPR